MNLCYNYIQRIWFALTYFLNYTGSDRDFAVSGENMGLLRYSCLDIDCLDHANGRSGDGSDRGRGSADVSEWGTQLIFS